MSSKLTEQVKVRIDLATKTRLGVETRRQNRSEGAIVRLALREYLDKQRPKGTGR